jgi:glycosyltransferase involved in cell wall biosynthesis
MRRFVLTAFFDGRPQDGGAYVHKRNMLSVFRLLQGEALKVVVICSAPEGVAVVKEAGLEAVLRRRSLASRIWGRLVSFSAVKATFGVALSKLPFGLDYFLRKLGTDLALFFGDDTRAQEMLTHNYIVQVWDLCHLEQPEFPEVSHRGEFERRERLNRAALPKATALVVDSEYGMGLMQRSYGIEASRIYHAPFLVDLKYDGAALDDTVAQSIRQTYRLNQPYVFYPAQFWPHKNHKYILRALGILKDRGRPVPQAVFSGSDKGMLAGILELAAELGVRNSVNYCGFVPDEHMPYLYKGAVALVMPTYFGPTNIPPMEAGALGVRVCYSDLPAFREQMGDAALYMDLERPEALADLLEALMDGGADPDSAARRASGYKTADAVQRHAAILKAIIGRYRTKIGSRLLG